MVTTSSGSCLRPSAEKISGCEKPDAYASIQHAMKVRTAVLAFEDARRSIHACFIASHFIN
jgi:hypothetical protein